MKRRGFLEIAGASGVCLQARAARAQGTGHPDEVHPGVWRFRLGAPEAITPVSKRSYPPAVSALRELPAAGTCPVEAAGTASKRGYLVRIPLGPAEAVYGYGLQLLSLAQRGGKKRLRVNADPKMDTGDSHAPVPFYLTTRGYGCAGGYGPVCHVLFGREKTPKPA